MLDIVQALKMKWSTITKFCHHTIYILVEKQCRGGNGTPLQYSCLENPMDEGAWWAAVHGVTKSQTWLSDLTFTFHFHALEKEMATHSSVFAWRIPGTGEPGGLPSMGSHRVRHDWSNLAAAAAASPSNLLSLFNIFVAFLGPLQFHMNCKTYFSISTLKQSLLGFWCESEVKIIQSCLTLCNPMDYAVHRILQVRILECVAVPFSMADFDEDVVNLYNNSLLNHKHIRFLIYLDPSLT